MKKSMPIFFLCQGIKDVFPAFRTYQQQDSQEFLRCFLDQMHQELRVPVYDWEKRDDMERTDSDLSDGNSGRSSRTTSQSSRSDSYETADSGWSSEQVGDVDVIHLFHNHWLW